MLFWNCYTSIIFVQVFVTLTVVSQAATITVPDDYPVIQWAIDNAYPGDTILVRTGTYIENIDVNKQLILKGVDTGAGLPVVDGGWSGNAIRVSANGVTIEGFNARNSSGAGIRVISNNNMIKNNIVSNNQHGIDLSNSVYNTISNNNVNLNNGVGISLFNSSGNTISGNIAGSNGIIQTEENGIGINQNSNNNLITGNIANSNGNKGIGIDGANGNTVSDNIANYNGREGIYLGHSDFTLIRNNSVKSNRGSGIILQFSNNNNITGNNASNSLNYIEGYPSAGIHLENSNIRSRIL
ncbi:Right handed beta helix region [uncultured archaeon]|nr:Right handed beta helix region [uncultured archaeon]